MTCLPGGLYYGSGKGQETRGKGEGRAFVAWMPFRRPELGEGEIGGWNPKYASNAQRVRVPARAREHLPGVHVPQLGAAHHVPGADGRASASRRDERVAPAAHFMLGAYSCLLELWGSQPGEADVDGDGRMDDAEVLKWLDLELMGEGWIAPRPFTHPDLGPIRIGDPAKKRIGRTTPAHYMEPEALRVANFVLWCAGRLPRVEVAEIRVRPATGDLYWINTVVTHDRAYPTSSDCSVTARRKPRPTGARRPALRFGVPSP